MTRRPKPKPRTYAKSASLSLDDLYYPCFVILLIISIGFLTSKSFGNSAKSLDTKTLRELESKVWISKDSDIGSLQLEVTEMIQRHPSSAFAHYLLGQLYVRRFIASPYEMHLLRQAAELGQQAIDLKPNKDFGYIVSSQVLDIMGYTQNALRLISPDQNYKIKESWRTLFLQAKFGAAQKNFEYSLALFRKSLKTKNTQDEVIIPHVLAVIESNLKNDSLIDEIRKWGKDFDNEIIQISLAIALTRQDRFQDARKVYDHILKQNPKSVESRINNGILLYQHLNKLDDGFNLLSSVLEDSKDQLSLQQAQIVKNHLATISLEKKDFKRAKDIYLSIIKSSDQPIDWVSISLKSYKDKNLLTEFSELISSVKQEIPGSGPLYAIHGEILSENLFNHEAAIESYENAILLEPNKSEFYNGLGLTYYRQQNMGDALSSFIAAIKIDPNDATARYNEACVLSLMGRSAEALGSLKEAVTLDPKLQITAKSDSDFENIRETITFRSIINDNKNLSQVSN